MAKSDFRRLTGRGVWVEDRTSAFNAARKAELVWRRFRHQSFDRVSELPLDVVIPLADKDLDVLPLTVAGLRRYLAHPIRKVFVVAASGAGARVASELGCEVIDEDGVLPLRREDIVYQADGMDRSGWLFQQLIKLSADAISSAAHILLLDADTVLIRPQTFTRRGKIVLLQSEEYHRPYFTTCEALLGSAPRSRLSFISHQLVVNRESLASLRVLIERRTRPWWLAIADSCDTSSISGFSEYELYGNYELASRHKVLRRWWANCSLRRENIASLAMLNQRYGARYRSLSFHAWL